MCARNNFREAESLTQLLEIMSGHLCSKLLVKRMAPNDNSKNQIYLGPGFGVLNVLPNNGVGPDSANRTFKAGLDLQWVNGEGELSPAPGAQLILYPQYPEVRMSGVLKSCRNAPSSLIASRTPDRILFLGVRDDRKIIAHVMSPENPASREILAIVGDREPDTGIFYEAALPRRGNSKQILLDELRRIHQLGWIDSKRLNGAGEVLEYKAANGGGYTLEAELGIPPNGLSEPDFEGWEVKQHKVSSFDRLETRVLTLMTPEPTGGTYRDAGVETFIRRFGYPDQRGREDRLNFGGIHRAGSVHPTTGLTLLLNGYDRETQKITDLSGGIALVSAEGEEAAVWGYSGLMEHWNRKHAQAVYVPSIPRPNPLDHSRRQYCYGPGIRLGEGTDFLLFLAAVAGQSIYYDPGIKLEGASSDKPRTKRRSQFRIKSGDLPAIYHAMQLVRLDR